MITIVVSFVMPSRLLYHMEYKSTSKRCGKLSAEGFARGDAVVIRGVLDGKAVAYELGARIARALSPGLYPGTAAPAVGTEECDRHAPKMLAVVAVRFVREWKEEARRELERQAEEAEKTEEATDE